MKKADKLTKMVGWYDPPQLLDTARKTFISTTIGENADPRLVAASSVSKRIFDYSRQLDKTERDFEVNDAPREEIWIDYASDVGDGWNSTYAVAYSLAHPELKVPGVEPLLQRGEILIFGGDGVYPTADTDTYEKKLINPYRMAFKAHDAKKAFPLADKVDLKAEPHVFALPGNHDWYDSLAAFQKIFCTHFYNQRIFAGAWRTRQEVGYFTLKLPHDWWLLGVDLQLSHNIDVRQLQYFESVIREMKPGDSVILCVPEPYWVKTIKYKGLTDAFEKKEESVEKLEQMIAIQGAEIRAYIAGDLHHYRRFESNDGRGTQKITAGGGGAFLHPTHDFDFKKNEETGEVNTKGFSLKTNYPAYKVSRTLDWRNLLFVFKNPTFGIMTAILYAALAWLVHGKVKGDFSLGTAFQATVESLINQPTAAIIVFLILILLVFFTDSNSKVYKRIGGITHGLFHLSAIFLLGWLGYYLSLKLTGKPMVETFNDSLIWYFCVIGISAIGGHLIGSFIMGLYLFVSLHIFGRHDNEAFSALKIEDYKNFLRLHIDKNGDLTIYPLKIEKVPRHWKEHKNADGKTEYYTPASQIDAQLIEAPIQALDK